jgi:hypothetical protein
MTAVLKCKIANKINSKAAAIFKEGLERTLSQVRHLCGTIERDEDGHHSIVRKRTSTVRFVVQHLEDDFTSFSEIADAHFIATALGDINVLSNAPHTCGNKPEAHPDNHPALLSFKANFIPGGLILNYHLHHYANGLAGSRAFIRQLSENCYAVAHNTPFPTFSPGWLDRASYGLPGFDFESPTPSSTPVSAPPRPEKNLSHLPSQFLLFHLPKSKAVLLKKAATPDDGTWITTYNAMCALMWRTLTKHRLRLYHPAPEYKPLWGQGVTISHLFTNPPLPERLQGNLQIDVTSRTSNIPELTVHEIVSDAPLSKLATYGTYKKAPSDYSTLSSFQSQRLPYVRYFRLDFGMIGI